LAATRNGIRSIICLPDGAPISKVEATRNYGAEVCMVPGVYDDAYKEALRLRDEYGYTFIHPFDDEYVIAGQGTIGLEILDEFPDVQAVVVPVGGGGLISGVAYTIKSLRPDVKVFGVQAAGAPSMVNSLEHGKIECLKSVRTIADGIAVKEPGEHTFEYCSKYVDKIVTVTDDEVSAAILAMIEQQKLTAEGAGAVSVAAAMFGKLPIEGLNTVCLVSGGNIDVTILSRVINRGLQRTGRMCRLTIELMDKPGQLQEVSSIIARCKGNVISVQHEHGGDDSDINACELRIEMETKNYEHIEEIRRALTEAGFNLL
jgi:threonine dehydratase